MRDNVGDLPIRPHLAEAGIHSAADVAGRAVKAGESLAIELLGITGQVPDRTGAWRYQCIGDFLGLDGQPDYVLHLTRGQPLPVTGGFRDRHATDGAVEFTLPRPKVDLRPTLGMRLSGLNDHGNRGPTGSGHSVHPTVGQFAARLHSKSTTPPTTRSR